MAVVELSPSIIRLKELCARLSVCRSTIYNWIETNPSFPKPISLGASAVGWISHEVDAWIESRITARKQAA